MELTTILFEAHSGVRYLVLLAGVAAFLYTLVAAVRSRPWDRTGRILMAVFTGVLDLQLLLGLVLVFLWQFYGALIGHITMMLLAAAVAHIGSVVNKRRPVERRSHMTAALASAGALVLIIGGIAAIQRAIL